MSLRPWILALGLLAVVPTDAGAATRDWVGSARCGQCHPRQLAAWQATAHARRFRATAGEGARCLGCHTTGEAPAGPVVESVVGCEACHGAGADYAAEDLMRNPLLAFELGLTNLGAGTAGARAALCAGCHAALSMRPQLDPARLTRPVHPLLEPSR